MSLLHQLKPHPKANKARKRVGRGPGSGTGKTSGRGHKGQKARGPGPRPGFEGGQMPIMRTMPKRGFTARSVVKYQVVNVGDLNEIESKDAIDVKFLKKNQYVSSLRKPIKVLGQGEISRALNLKVNAASKSAVVKIEKAGGHCEIVGTK